MAQLKSESGEVFDNRVITTAMADEYWTRNILEQCVNGGTSGMFDTSIDTSLITVEGDWRSVSFESEHYDEETLFLVKMSVINGNEFWNSDTMTGTEVHAKILFDSGYDYPEVQESLAIVDFSEVEESLYATADYAINANE